jgi:hypothetical protein
MVGLKNPGCSFQWCVLPVDVTHRRSVQITVYTLNNAIGDQEIQLKYNDEWNVCSAYMRNRILVTSSVPLTSG